jgi:hypothetical protein
MHRETGHGGSYHICSGWTFTKREIVLAVAEAAYSPFNLEFVAREGLGIHKSASLSG